jgi:hypothetical protein
LSYFEQKLIKSGDNISADYIVPFEDDTNLRTSKEINNNDKSMAIVHILRKLYPDKTTYIVNGHGHQFIPKLLAIPEEYSHDGTQKNIDKTYLPLQSLVNLNHIFISLIRYKYRLSTWYDYANMVIEIRKNIVSLFRSLTMYLKIILKNKKPFRISDEIVTLYEKCIFLLQNPPKYPKCAVDEYGYYDESSEENQHNDKDKVVNNKKTITNDLFKDISTKFFSSLSNSLNHFTSFLQGNDANPLFLHNLVDSCRILEKYQIEFNQLFKHYNINQLFELENNERIAYLQFFTLCYYKAFKSNVNFKTIDRCVNFVTVRFPNDFISKLSLKLKGKDISYSIHTDLDYPEKSIWIIININDTILNGIDNAVFTFNEMLNIPVVHDAFKEVSKSYNHNMLNFLFKLHFDSVYLLYTYSNKQLLPGCKKASALSAINGQCNFYDMEIPSTVDITRFNISQYPNSIFEETNKFVNSFNNLRFTLEHLTELFETESFKDSSSPWLTEYCIPIATSLGVKLQDFIDSIVNIQTKYSNEIEQYPVLTQAYDEFIVVYKQFFPDPNQKTDGAFETKINNDIISAWCKRLEEHSTIVIMLYIVLRIATLNEHMS